MKKIVTLGAIAVLAAGFIFADEPAADVSITEFTGNAKVTWGVDLDAMKTGFKNTTEANFKVKLFSAGDKSTEGDGVWGELKIKSDDGLKNENGTWTGPKAYVDVATVHINDFFVGIKEGDTTLGTYRFDGAIRSADNDNAKWLGEVGPGWDDWAYNYGIQAGYDSTDLKIAFDIRSLIDAKKEQTQYSNSYSVALEAELKDTNQWLEGLFVKGGFGYNLSGEWYTNATVVNSEKEAVKEKDPDDKNKEKEVYEFDKFTGTAKKKMKNKDAFTSDSPVKRNWIATITAPKGVTFNGSQNGHVFGYAVQAGYKYKLDDKYFVKPAVAFEGATTTQEVNYGDNKWGKASTNGNALAFGVIFGWGDTADDNAGIYYLDSDSAKKVTPGVSVVVDIPLASTATYTLDKTYKTKTHGSALAIITPSFYTNGDLVEGLTAALYSEMALLRYKDWGSNDATHSSKNNDSQYSDPSCTQTNSDGTDSETWNNAVWKDEKFAFAITGGLKYAIKSGDITATPQAAFRFANVAYAENKINSISPLKTNPVFDKLGSQETYYTKLEDNVAKVKYGNGGYVAGFFNIKAGVEVQGLVPNTTFDLVWESANLMNKIDYSSKEITKNGKTFANPYYLSAGSGSNYEGAKWYNVKLGHVDVGCKIAF